jgi:hypothetical protein
MEPLLVILTNRGHAQSAVEMTQRFLPRLAALFPYLQVAFGDLELRNVYSAGKVLRSLGDESYSPLYDLFVSGAFVEKVVEGVSRDYRCQRQDTIIMMSSFMSNSVSPDERTWNWLSKRKFVGLTHSDDRQHCHHQAIFPHNILTKSKFLDDFQFDIEMSSWELDFKSR